MQKGLRGKNRAFVKNQCAEGTLVKFGHFGEKMGLLGKLVREEDALVKIELVKVKTEPTRAFREDEFAKGATWVKTGLWGKIRVLKGL